MLTIPSYINFEYPVPWLTKIGNILTFKLKISHENEKKVRNLFKLNPFFYFNYRNHKNRIKFFNTFITFMLFCRNHTCIGYANMCNVI